MNFDKAEAKCPVCNHAYVGDGYCLCDARENLAADALAGDDDPWVKPFAVFKLKARVYELEAELAEANATIKALHESTDYRVIKLERALAEAASVLGMAIQFQAADRASAAGGGDET